MSNTNLRENILFSTCALVDEKIYSFTNQLGLPIVIDLNSQEIHFLENVKGWKPFNIDYMLCLGDNIFILELNGRRLMKYNVTQMYCQFYGINCGEKEWENYILFANYKDCLYIFPKYKNMIVRMDINSEDMKIEWLSYPEENGFLQKNQENIEYFACGCQISNKALLIGKSGDFIIIYDMENNFLKKHMLSIKIKDCVHMVPYDNQIYLLSSEGMVYSWNSETNSIKALTDYKKKMGKIHDFSRIAVTDKDIFVLPALGKNILKIDIDTKEIDKYKNYPYKFSYFNYEWSKYYGYCENEEYYYFAMRSSNYVLTINKHDSTINWIKPADNFQKEYLYCCQKYNKILPEQELCSIKDFVCFLNRDYTNSISNNLIDKNSHIWNAIKMG